MTLIDFIRLKWAHSGINMAKEAFKTLQELEIKDKASLNLFREEMTYHTLNSS